MHWVKGRQGQSVTDAVGSEILLGSAAHLLERWMWEEERVVSAKVAQRVDSEDRGKDGAKVRTKEKVKVGLQTQRKEAAWAKVWVVKVTKELAGHVARCVTRRERGWCRKGRAGSGRMAEGSGRRGGGWWRMVCGPGG